MWLAASVKFVGEYKLWYDTFWQFLNEAICDILVALDIIFNSEICTILKVATNTNS